VLRFEQEPSKWHLVIRWSTWQLACSIYVTDSEYSLTF